MAKTVRDAVCLHALSGRIASDFGLPSLCSGRFHGGIVPDHLDGLSALNALFRIARSAVSERKGENQYESRGWSGTESKGSS
jgi:hypothetical protein